MRSAEPRLILFLVILLGLASLNLLGCGDDDDDDYSSDDDDAAGDDDSSDDDDDLDDDDTASECEPGKWECSDNAFILTACENGTWLETNCMLEFGRLCEEGACVDPWKYGSPTYNGCSNDPDATTMSLAEKAAKYDEIAPRLHIHPEDKRIHHVTVAPGLTEANATYDDVINWHTGENDGLWTGLYIAAQAFRYAVTGEQAVLDILTLMMDGMEIGTDITGVPGIFTREYITPGVIGMSCPADPMEYVPDAEKDDNQWVKVDTDGAILTYDDLAVDWVRSNHFVPNKFAGYCWLDNVSQDEYAGHMLALASVYKLVDDPGIKGRAAALLEKVAVHLMENDMGFVDWDGRYVEHGRLWPLSLTDFPGFSAVLGLDWVKPGAVASGREDLNDFYWDCLLQKSGSNDCLDQYLTPPQSFADWFWFMGLYVGADACKSNWNNFSMAFVSMFSLIWYEHDDIDLRRKMQWHLEFDMFGHSDNYREMRKQHNSAWAIMAAAMKGVGPGTTGHDIEAVEDAICALRQFPESETQPAISIGENEFPTDWTCESRFDDRFLTFEPVPVYQRCPGSFVWWGNPYRHQNCAGSSVDIKQPADYLLPYWMGRYFGFIDASW
jgi:hypothetical protein